MNVRIETLPEKKCIGKSLRMSLTKNKTEEIWRSFMIDKSAISNTVGTDLYSIQVYDTANYFRTFNPQTEFTKWAAIEVIDLNNIPIGFDAITLSESLYGVFTHKGDIHEFKKTIQYIFGEWLPKSEYELDKRPHFELLGEKYKNNDLNSEEEVWIPIKNKNLQHK